MNHPHLSKGYLALATAIILLYGCESGPTQPDLLNRSKAPIDTVKPPIDTVVIPAVHLFELPSSVGSVWEYHYSKFSFRRTPGQSNSSETRVKGRHVWTLARLDSTATKLSLTFTISKTDTVHDQAWQPADNTHPTPILLLDTTYTTSGPGAFTATITADSMTFYWGAAGYARYDYAYDKFLRKLALSQDTVGRSDSYLTSKYVSRIGLVSSVFNAYGMSGGVGEDISLSSFLPVSRQDSAPQPASAKQRPTR